MISIIPQPLGKFCTGRRLCRREALCLHRCDGVEILLDCGSNRLCHGFSPFLMLCRPSRFRSGLRWWSTIRSPR